MDVIARSYVLSIDFCVSYYLSYANMAVITANIVLVASHFCHQFDDFVAVVSYGN